MYSTTSSKRPLRIIPIVLTFFIGTSFYLESTSAASLSRRTRSRTINTTNTRVLQTTPSKGGGGTKAPSFVPPGTKSPSYVPKLKCKELQLKKLKPPPDPKDKTPPPPGRYLIEMTEDEFAQAAYQHFQQQYYPNTANAPSDPLPPKDPLAPAPVPPKKTLQPTVEGGYVWEWVPVECPAPSANPSKSPQPSKTPSKSPTKSPTVSPAPSLSPKCREEGGIQTNTSIKIKYQYEMVSSGSSNTKALDKLITAALKNSLIDCGNDDFEGDSINRRELFSNGRKLSVAGIDTSGTDVITNQACTILSSSGGNACNVINGEMTVYMEDESQQDEDAVPKTATAQRALQIIKSKMESESFLQDGILKLSYKAGCIEGLTDCSFAIVQPKPGGNSALSSDNSSSTTALSATGISVIVVASVLGLLIVAVVTKRRTRTQNRVVEELIEEEEDDDLFGKQLPEIDEERTDIMSMHSSPWGERGARVVGDDDSVFDFDSPSSGRLYGLQASNSYGSGHDVHKCTSATCYICKGQNRTPTFVVSDVVEQMEKRSYSYSNTVEI